MSIVITENSAYIIIVTRKKCSYFLQKRNCTIYLSHVKQCNYRRTRTPKLSLCKPKSSRRRSQAGLKPGMRGCFLLASESFLGNHFPREHGEDNAPYI
jgi:hypothetical protein